MQRMNLDEKALTRLPEHNMTAWSLVVHHLLENRRQRTDDLGEATRS
jgi:hypothetical protein